MTSAFNSFWGKAKWLLTDGVAGGIHYTGDGQGEERSIAKFTEEGGSLGRFLGLMGFYGGSGGFGNFSNPLGRLENFANSVQLTDMAIDRKTGNGNDTIINYKNDMGYGRSVIFKVDTGQYKWSGEGDYMIRK